MLAYFFILNITYFLLTILAFFVINEYMKRTKILDYRDIFASGIYKPISIIMPAYNEEVTVVDSFDAILRLHYPEFEVLVVNDGSKDNTVEVMKERYNLVKIDLDKDYLREHPEIESIWISRVDKVTLVNKPNGGKASALNVGIHVSRYPLVCAIDCDSILDRDALLRIARPFFEDAHVVAAGGTVRVANNCRIEFGQVKKVRFPNNIWAGFQVVEYLRAFLMGRMGWEGLNSLFIISGAFGLFDKRVIKEVGGYNEHTVGEDMELIVRMHRYLTEKKRDYRITFVPDPICWTEAPTLYKSLRGQRNRWQRGVMETLWQHRKIMLNPRYGVHGLITFPYFVLFEMLGPVIEMAGYILALASWALGIVNFSFMVAFFGLAFLLSSLLSFSAIVLEEISFKKYASLGDIIKLGIFSILESFFYRPLTVIWRLQGIRDYFLQKKGWGEMKRKGLG